nr:hypothetical protein [Mycobacterium lepromatosis]
MHLELEVAHPVGLADDLFPETEHFALFVIDSDPLARAPPGLPSPGPARYRYLPRFFDARHVFLCLDVPAIGGFISVKVGKQSPVVTVAPLPG